MINYSLIFIILFQSIKINEISILYFLAPIFVLFLNKLIIDINIVILFFILILGSIHLSFLNPSIPLILLYFIYFYALSKNSEINVKMVISYSSFVSAILSIIQIIIFVNNNGIVFSSINGDLRVSGITQSPVDNLFLLGCGLLLSTRKVSNTLYTLAVLLTLARSLVFPLFLKMFSSLKIFKYYIYLIISLLVLIVYFTSSEVLDLIVLRLNSFTDVGLYSIRSYLFESALIGIFDSPSSLLFGYGWGNVNFYVASQMEYFNNLHNVYLSIWYQAGSFAIILYFIFILNIYLKSRKASNNFKKIIYLFLILSCFDNLLFTSCSSLIFAILTGEIFRNEKNSNN